MHVRAAIRPIALAAGRHGVWVWEERLFSRTFLFAALAFLLAEVMLTAREAGAVAGRTASALAGGITNADAHVAAAISRTSERRLRPMAAARFSGGDLSWRGREPLRTYSRWGREGASKATAQDKTLVPVKAVYG